MRSAAQGGVRAAWWGLVERRQRWTLSRRGWLAGGLTVVVAAGLFVWQIHPFLAVNRPVTAEWAIIQGWIPRHALEACLPELERLGCRQFITAGGWLSYTSRLDPDDTYADLAAQRLRKLGVKREHIVAVPDGGPAADEVGRSARAVRRWLEARGLRLAAVNVVTVGTHARKTRLAYQQALGSQTAVGVLAVPARDYDPRRWWQSSEGVKQVIEEAAAYLHVRLGGCGE